MLDFRIKTFLVVWEEKSYTRAAERLFVTQPAVSQHIKYLEERFGTPLLSFMGKELRLTEAGNVLYRFASAAEAEGKKTEALIRSKGAEVPLRFGATRTIGEYVLPSSLADFLKDHPETDISMLVDNTDVLLAKLLDGAIDFAFIEGVFDRESFETSVFLRDAFVPVCSALDPLSSRSVEIGDLFDRRLIVREKGSGSRSLLENALASFNVTIGNFHRVLELGNLEVIKNLVAQGLGISFLYERSIGQELNSGKISRIALKDFSVLHEYSFVRLKNSVYEKDYQDFLGSVIRSNGG